MDTNMEKRRKKMDGPKPGTKAFGERARIRRDKLMEQEGRGDLRIKTARKRAKGWRDRTNRYLKGD